MKKKIIPFINTNSENQEVVIPLAKKYLKAGADELYIFCYANSDIERDEYFSLLKKVTEEVNISVIAGMYLKRLDDAKRAFNAGAKRLAIQYRYLDDISLFNEVVKAHGAENVYLELDQKEFMAEDFEVKRYIIKHLTLTDEFINKVQALDGEVLFRDSLKKNPLRNLLDISNVHAVSTDGLRECNLCEIKGQLREAGIDIPVLNKRFEFSELKKNEDDMIPVIVQDYMSNDILMLAYMNEEAYDMTFLTGKMHYHSRSRNELWCKGDTSGHYQYVRNLYIDCDKDTILAKVRQIGAACHTGNRTCFFTELS